MKPKNKHIKFLISICSCMILCCLMLSACSSEPISANDSSIVMVKNSSMATYGSGFAVGVPGKPVDTIVTAYSVVATTNGAAPKTAEVMIDEFDYKIIANVIYFDSSKNIAILKLPKSPKGLKPLLLTTNVNNDKDIFVRGYSGTGNITTSYENFNTTDIIQYVGRISSYSELNSMVVYRFGNEFNRAMVGAPAMDKSGNVIGMCAYSIDKMNTYSQYILSSEELIGCFASQDIEFMTLEELTYKNIITYALIIGGVLLVLIILFGIFGGRGKKKAENKVSEKENNLEPKEIYIKITGGTLAGQTYKLDTKLSIGRDGSRCEIAYPINEPGVSAVHCTVKKEGTDLYLVDDYSKHGTFLEDGTKVSPSLPHKITGDFFAFYLADPRNRFEIGDKKEN